MKSPLEPETILQNRYLITGTIETTECYRTYLAEDQQAGNENCILREFVGLDESEVVRVQGKFMPILNQLRTLSHPQLEKLKDFFTKGANFYLVQSYFAGKTYQTRLSKDSLLTEDEAIELLKQTLTILSYLDSQSVIHSDISPSHLLVRIPDNVLVLTDFGILREIATEIGIETAGAKILDRLGEITAIPSGRGQDLSALAVTVLMLLTGKEPQELFNPQTQTWDWEDYRLLSDQLTDVLNRMLLVNSTGIFPTPDAILAHLNPPKVNIYPQPPQIENTRQFNPDFYSQPTPAKFLDSKYLIIIASILGFFAIIVIILLINFKNRNNSLDYTFSPSPSPSFFEPSLSPSPSPSISTNIYLDESNAVSIVENLYSLLSSGQYDQAVQLFSPELAYQFNAQFFGQFNRVTVENLQVTSRTDSTINFEGENTYFYPDGSTQRELRSYTVSNLQGQIKITASNFIKVTQFRPKTSSNSSSQAPITSPSSFPPSATQSINTNATVSGTPGTKNMRSGAGTNYGIVGTVRTGDRVQILGSSYDRGGYQWFQVYDPQSDTKGWIAAQLINRD